MEALQAKILGIVDTGGGRVLYETVYDQLDAVEQRLLPRAIKDLKARGIAMNQNRYDSEQGVVFEIFRLPEVAE